MGKNNTNPTKYAALVTYCLALVSLLLGLFLPAVFEGENITDSMLALQLPAAIDALFGTELGGAAFTLAYPFPFFGLDPIDLGAILVLLYALFTACGIIALIPVIASKKENRTALKAASVIEILALTPLAVLMFIEMFKACAAAGEYVWNYSLIAAFGGTLLMLIIQSFVYKKGSGVIKFVLFLLSAIAVLVAIYPIYLLIPALAEPLSGILGEAPGLVEDMTGIEYLTVFFMSPESVFGGEATAMIFSIALILASLMTLINFMLDMYGMGKVTSKAMLVMNIIRYVIEVIAIILMIVMGFVLEAAVGILSYVFVGIAVVQLVINIVRTCTYKVGGVTATVVTSEKAEKKSKKEKKDKKAKKEEVAVAAPATVEAVEKKEEEPRVVYTVGPIYDGPTDKFIDTLTNDEKIEFARVFLERKSGNLNNIPKYNVGGDNSKFFSSVFIYYGRVRGLVSDGLMNKFYQQGNIM